MKLRDIISHHYHHVDHEIIYDICQSFQASS
ncbi:MAG: HepT-like ribonuclease domain-containing protein [Desulfobacterales bacterium]